MTTNEFEHEGTHVTEKHFSYQECESTYGTSAVGELNRKFAADAIRATD